MSSVSVLPRLFRWLFTALEALFALAAVAVCALLLLNPRLPPGTHFGPLVTDFAGQPGSVELRAVGGDSNLMVSAFHGSLTLFVGQAGGMIEVVKHAGLPLVLISAIFFIALFDLLRRLFRNVGRGDSFTPQSVLLVQFIGGALIVYSIVSAYAESWFAGSLLAYLAQHAVITVSGTALHLAAPHGMAFLHVHGFPFGSPLFFSGLLVLALSEVFRQGLAIKSENDLTV